MDRRDQITGQFQKALHDCQRLYVDSARTCVEQLPDALPGSPEEFSQLMDDLHRGLLIKTYVTIVEADERWSREEKRLGKVLFNHIWPGEVTAGRLREAAGHVFREASTLRYASLVRPFAQIAPLRDRRGEVETIVVRIANLVAKSDGAISPAETRRLHEVQRELETHLYPKDDQLHPPTPEQVRGGQAVQQIQEETEQIRQQYEIRSELAVENAEKTTEEKLAEALERLDTLIGLAQVKHEIRTLTNFLKLQQQRAAAGLPRTELSLHLVFGGNPGTGKTTVARIVGQIYGSMGILDKGHLVETDRSGLVAEFAGQTGPKTNKIVDQALDGVLFIDEAYSLVSETGDDPYGREALQTLLKRMEDDRQRLVVILAGYPEQMEHLLRANPGLSSRFNTKLTFEDYTPAQLGQIFGRMCEQNHYRITPDVQIRLLQGFAWLYQNRDEHFGNGRLVRNSFESAVRWLANRVAGVAEFTEDVLTTFSSEDVRMDSVPEAVFGNSEGLRLRVACDGCQDETEVPANYVGRRVRCRKCDNRFRVEWGEPVTDS